MIWQRSAWLCAVLALGLLSVAETRAQVAASRDVLFPQTVTDVLKAMSERAGVIFTGRVLAVHAATETPGVVEVEFHVDTAVRGCSPGSYTLREWSGLWAAGVQRYRVGDRLLMLLHAPGVAGLSSPVDGLDGAIPIRQGGKTKPYTGTSAPPRIVDLRWLGAKLPRGVSYQSVSSARARRMSLPPVPFVATPETVVAMQSGASGSLAVVSPLSGYATDSSVPAQQASVNAVVAMLTAWETVRHVAP